MYLFTPGALMIASAGVRWSTGWSRWINVVMLALTVFETICLIGISASGVHVEGWAFFPQLFGF